MSKIKTVSSYCWSLISDNSKEENQLCFMWIGLNTLALSAYIMVKLIGA